MKTNERTNRARVWGGGRENPRRGTWKEYARTYIYIYIYVWVCVGVARSVGVRGFSSRASVVSEPSLFFSLPLPPFLSPPSSSLSVLFLVLHPFLYLSFRLFLSIHLSLLLLLFLWCLSLEKAFQQFPAIVPGERVLGEER